MTVAEDTRPVVAAAVPAEALLAGRYEHRCRCGTRHVLDLPTPAAYAELMGLARLPEDWPALSPREAEFARLLLGQRGGFVATERVREAFGPFYNQHYVRVAVGRLRVRLADTGWRIECAHGAGIRLLPPDHPRAKELPAPPVWHRCRRCRTPILGPRAAHCPACCVLVGQRRRGPRTQQVRVAA